MSRKDSYTPPERDIKVSELDPYDFKTGRFFPMISLRRPKQGWNYSYEFVSR